MPVGTVCYVKGCHSFNINMSSKTKNLYWQGCSSPHFGQWSPNMGAFKKKTFYPLVICYIAIENGHRNSGFSHEKWWFPIAMLIYQRVPLCPPWCSHPCPGPLGAVEDVTIACTRNIFPAETLDFVMTLGDLVGPLTWVLKPYWAWDGLGWPWLIVVYNG